MESASDSRLVTERRRSADVVYGQKKKEAAPSKRIGCSRSLSSNIHITNPDAQNRVTYAKKSTYQDRILDLKIDNNFNKYVDDLRYYLKPSRTNTCLDQINEPGTYHNCLGDCPENIAHGLQINTELPAFHCKSHLLSRGLDTLATNMVLSAKMDDDHSIIGGLNQSNNAVDQGGCTFYPAACSNISMKSTGTDRKARRVRPHPVFQTESTYHPSNRDRSKNDLDFNFQDTEYLQEYAAGDLSNNAERILRFKDDIPEGYREGPALFGKASNASYSYRSDTGSDLPRRCSRVSEGVEFRRLVSSYKWMMTRATPRHSLNPQVINFSNIMYNTPKEGVKMKTPLVHVPATKWKTGYEILDDSNKCAGDCNRIERPTSSRSSSPSSRPKSRTSYRLLHERTRNKVQNRVMTIIRFGSKKSSGDDRNNFRQDNIAEYLNAMKYNREMTKYIRSCQPTPVAQTNNIPTPKPDMRSISAPPHTPQQQDRWCKMVERFKHDNFSGRSSYHRPNVRVPRFPPVPAEPRDIKQSEKLFLRLHDPTFPARRSRLSS